MIILRLLAFFPLLASARAEEKRIAVFGGLCDNATRWIVKVGAKIGGLRRWCRLRWA